MERSTRCALREADLNLPKYSRQYRIWQANSPIPPPLVFAIRPSVLGLYHRIPEPFSRDVSVLQNDSVGTELMSYAFARKVSFAGWKGEGDEIFFPMVLVEQTRPVDF